MAKWSIEVNTGAGFSSRRFHDFDFQILLNQMGRLHAVLLPGSAAPSEGNEVKLWWDKGGSQERLWFRGSITTKTKDDISGLIEVWCFDDSFGLFQSQLGSASDFGFRKFAAQTPYTIIQSAGAPLGLLYNAQGNLIMSYGTSAPNAITAVSPGNALNFRAQTGRNLLNIARLCEQATSGGGPTYGLEWFVDRDGADAKRFNLVTRRQRAAIYTAEAFQIGRSLHRSPRSTETENAVDRVKVIGEGSGASRIESSWVGAGARELVYTDKNVYDATTATNLANRIYNALSTGTSPRFDAKTYRHNMTTHVGDDVSVTPKGGGGATTYRCLGISYKFKGERAFTLELGRSRRFFSSILRDVERSLDAMDVHGQVTDAVPDTLEDEELLLASPGAPRVVAAGAKATIVNITAGIPTDFGKGDAYFMYVALDVDSIADPSVDSHTHDMGNHTHNMNSHAHTYDRTDDLLVTSGANSGNAGADPHTHNVTVTHTPTSTSAPSTASTLGPSTNTTSSASPGLAVNGPFQIEFYAARGGSQHRLAMWVVGHLRSGLLYELTNTYPFSFNPDGNYTPTTIGASIRNDGDVPITLGTASIVAIARRELHRHNET